MLHIVLHFAVPAVGAPVIHRHLELPGKLWGTWLVLISTMVVDLDHLLAVPIYDPTRCSLGFHPLHTIWAILFYFGLLGFKKSRLLSIGLLIHMGLDGIDCLSQAF